MEVDAGLRQQVEYYMSDKNLEKDGFFYEKVLNDDGGYIDLDLILNCNKIKALNATKDSIGAAIKNSTEVELSAEGNRIRRKGNKALPEPKFKNKKTVSGSGQAGNQI